MTGPRIPFPDSGGLDTAMLAQLARRPPAHLYRMVAHAPPLLEPFLSLVVANFNQLSLAAQVREAVILRVGSHHRSAYEIHHHRRMARDAGLDASTIAAVLEGAVAASLPHGLQAPIAVADALLAESPVPDALVQRVVGESGHRGYVELALLVGFYRMVATFLAATGIEPEPAGALAHWRPPAG